MRKDKLATYIIYLGGSLTKLGTLILFLLMLPIIGIPITSAIYTENHNVVNVDYSNYNNVIKYLSIKET